MQTKMKGGNEKNKTQLSRDLAFFVQFVLVGYSGLVMSFNHHAADPILRLIHDEVGILMLVFFIVHIALHWRWIVLTTKNFLREREMKEDEVLEANYTPVN